MELLNETIQSSNTLLVNCLLYAIPFILVVFTLILYSGLIEKLSKNCLKIVAAITDFLEKLTTKKFKLSTLILTIIYVVLVIAYLIIKE